VWDIEDRILSLQWLSGLTNEARKSAIENAFPQAIAEFFPRSTLPTAERAPSGLINLREISRPSVPAGIPQRHSA
jgi:hypothetical protein